MNKDVIYIDVEDDITAIIGKVKSAKEKIVAIVPPKRIGVLQSAVNLRLLARAASQANKHLVVITNNQALAALSAAAMLPVAKNLQSKPGLAEIPALDVDDGEDVIDGAQLPVGDLAKTAPISSGRTVIPVVDNTDTAVDEIAKAAAPTAGGTLASPKSKKGSKVPNFNLFRKKLLLIIGGGVLLLILLVWAFFFAGSATVLITARTTDSSVNTKVTFDPAAATDITTSVLRSTSQQIKKDASIEFDATGKKDVGDKAAGQVIFKNCETPTAQTIPAGTVIRNGSNSYVTMSAATVSAATGFATCASAGTSTAIAITAQDIGPQANTVTGTGFDVDGHSSSTSSFYFKAVASTDIAGGSKRQAVIVSADDITKATAALLQKDTDALKAQLKTQFGDKTVALDSSFAVTQTGAVSVPAADQELVTGAAKPKLTASLTYTLVGVDKSEIKTYLDAYFAKQLTDSSKQRVYSNGADKVTFTNIDAPAGGKITGNIVATAQVGPKIDDTVIKSTAAGKRYGEIQAAIESIQGVSSVDVKFSPFWVTQAPSDPKKINVEFKLDESK